MVSCQTQDKSKNQEDKKEISEIEDDYVGGDKGKSYSFGKISLQVDGETLDITSFGLDPYTVMNWFTPESGATPMAGVVFKSADFKRTLLVSFKDFDAMQTNFTGEQTLKNGLPTINLTDGENTYMFTEGSLLVESFSRKTGKVKLKATGKCTRSSWGDPSAMKQNLPCTLEVDALMPLTNVDGLVGKTEASQKFNIQ